MTEYQWSVVIALCKVVMLIVTGGEIDYRRTTPLIEAIEREEHK